MERPEALEHYPPLPGRDSPEPDWFGGTGFTVAGATRGVHPPKMIYPADRRYFIPGIGADSTAKLSLRSLGPGVYQQICVGFAS
jgi:hypothetical protein